MLKERVVAIIFEFVPVSYNLDVLEESQKVECNSRIDVGAIVLTRWIQPLQRRADWQQMAHLITRLKMPEDANWTIKNGLIMAGKGVWARRMRRDPRRCLKCQAIGANHFAVGCGSQNVCGTCPCMPQVHGVLQEA